MKDVSATVIVNLDRSEEEIFDSLRKQTRTGIKKAIKSGLTVSQSDEWEEAYEIYKQTRLKNNLKIHSLEKLKSLADKLFVCKKDGKIIAVNITWFVDEYDKTIPRTMTNTFLKEYAEYRPNELLYWEIFKYYKNLGHKKFDLGGYTIKVRENLDHVNKFKESFGEVVYYHKDYPIHKAIGRKLVRNSDFLWNLNKKMASKKEGGETSTGKDLFKKNVEGYSTDSSVKHYEKLNNLKDVENILIEKYFRGKVLDLGCGVGRTTKHLADRGFDVIGVDIVGDMIERAKEIYPGVKFEQGDACSLKYKDEEFDIVFFSFNGLDYIHPESQRVVALKEIERVLKKDGYFIYSSHNPLSLMHKFRPGFIIRNLKEGKLFSKYKSEKNNFATFYTYFATPKNQVKLVEGNTGFKFVEQMPNTNKELHPHYVFRKE